MGWALGVVGVVAALFLALQLVIWWLIPQNRSKASGIAIIFWIVVLLTIAGIYDMAVSGG